MSWVPAPVSSDARPSRVSKKKRFPSRVMAERPTVFKSKLEVMEKPAFSLWFSAAVISTTESEVSLGPKGVGRKAKSTNFPSGVTEPKSPKRKEPTPLKVYEAVLGGSLL